MSVAIRAITRVQDADDAPMLGAGQDGYALTWNNATSAFVATALPAAGVTDHGALTGLADDDHTQYLLATGTRTGASSQAQAFTAGVITGAIKPAADSTTALQLQNAAGTSVLNVDTTNVRVGIGTTNPDARLTINGNMKLSAGSVFGIGATDANNKIYIEESKADLFGLRLTLKNTSVTSTSYSALVLYAANTAVALQFYADGLGTGPMGTPGSFIGNFSNNPVGFFTNNTERLRILATGYVGIGTTAPATLLQTLLTSAATNAVTNVVTIGHDTTGTAAAGFGAGLAFRLESSTTAAQDAARIKALWYEATHASRKADLVLTAYDTAEREGLRIRGAGSAPAIGFYGVTPIERATLATGAGASVDDVITALQNLGLVKQS